MPHLRIAFVTDVIYPFIIGGAQKRIYDFSTHLAKRGHEVHVFGVKWWKGKSEIELDGVVLHGLSQPLYLYTHGRRTIIEPILFSLSLALHAQDFSFDVVDVSEFPLLPCFSMKLATMLTQVPYIITWHEVWGPYWRKYLRNIGYLGSLVERQISMLPNHCIAVSPKIRRGLISIGVEESDITLIPNPLDLDAISKLKATDRRTDLISVGRLIKEKNLDVLIRAVAILAPKHSSLHCDIVGDGPERIRLVKLADELGVSNRIAFMGWISDHAYVLSLMKSAKLFVLPSSREGFSIALAEAKACKLPAIVYSGHDTAAQEMMRDGWDGLLFDHLEPNELASRIDLLLSREGFRQELSENALLGAETFELGKVIPQLESTYSVVCDNFGRSSRS